jgi:hypothetical protein
VFHVDVFLSVDLSGRLWPCFSMSHGLALGSMNILTIEWRFGLTVSVMEALLRRLRSHVRDHVCNLVLCFKRSFFMLTKGYVKYLTLFALGMICFPIAAFFFFAKLLCPTARAFTRVGYYLIGNLFSRTGIK